MKSGHHPPHSNDQRPQAGAPRPSPAPFTRAPWKKWLFRMVLSLGTPLLLLAGLETALRVAGYGYTTAFFLPARIQGENRLLENPRFGWRFFPPRLARTPQPVNIPAVKPANVRRIFVFGESAAMGDPEPAYGFPRMLKVLLEARFPGQKFEVVNTAMTAINSHVILPQARECARRDGDIWIIYMGNNEVVGPFGAGTVLGAPSASLFLARTSIALRSLKLGQWLSTVAARYNGSSQPQRWEGMEMFLREQLPSGDRRLGSVYRHFSSNLAGCLEAGLQQDVRVLLCTMGVNLKDCPPFASQHRPQLTATALAEWNEAYQQACQLQAGGENAKALQAFKKAAQIDDSYAEMQFRWAQCAEHSGDKAEARRHYELACDQDTLRFRADRRINQLIPEALLSHPKVRLLDVAEQFRQASPDGIPGSELFYEHVHFTPEGNYLLARQAAQGVAESLGLDLLAGTSWISLQECLRHLGFTPWHQLQILENLLARLQKPPFTSQLDYNRRVEHLAASIRDLKGTFTTNSLKSWMAAGQEALAQAPDDWYLHSQWAKLLEANGQTEAAISHWRRVVELSPNYVMGYFQLGKLLNRGQNRSETIALMKRALQIVPHFPEAYNSLGIAYAHQKQPDQAYDSFAQALKFRPDYPEALMNWGMTLSSFGRTNEALAQFQQAVRLKPDYAEAYHKAGLLLARLGRLSEAQADFAKAVAAKPSFVTARFDLGIVLAKQHRFEEAAAQFQEVLRLDPTHPAARSMMEKALQLRQPAKQAQ